MAEENKISNNVTDRQTLHHNIYIKIIIMSKRKDICENGGDMAHFAAVHEASIFSGDFCLFLCPNLALLWH